MPYTKTQQIKEARRAAAEIVQARSAARPLEIKVKEAGAKEILKLIRKHGAEAIKAIQTKL